jgi:hypothetical protein
MTPRDIVGDALELIKPQREQKAACAATITERVALLRRVHLDLGAIPSPGELKKELEEIGNDLQTIRAAFRKYTEACRNLIFYNDAVKREAFLDQLDHLIVSAQWHHAALVVPPGSHRWDNVKALAGRFAKELLTTFSASPLTRARSGAFYRLATLLYEGITGEVVSLEQYCRDVLDKADEPGGGRIEPSIVVRIPPR